MRVSRKELYELVWSRPIVHAAKQFGVSGSYLARICGILQVPRPERGYWAKLQAGGAPSIPPLPQAEPWHPLEWPTDSTEVPTRVLIGARPAIAPPSRSRNPSSKVSVTHTLVLGARGHFENTRAIEDDDYLKPFKRLLVDITSSKSALTTALEIANTLFNALELAGYRVSIARQDEFLRRAQIETREVPSKRPESFYVTKWSPGQPTVVYMEGAVIGLALIEMSEEVFLRYVDGKYIRESQYSLPKRSRHFVDHSWTTTRDLPSGRFRLVAYSPYHLVTWSMNWQETAKSSLISQIPSIVQTIRNSTQELIGQIAEAEERQERFREKLRAEEEQRSRDEDRARVRAAEKESREHLEQIIQAWARVRNLERFFRGVQLRSRNLSDEDRERVHSQLALARECIGSQDPLEVFLSWKAPQERYRSKYPSEIANVTDKGSDDE